MELGQVQTIISHALDEIQSDQIDSLVKWLDDEISKYRLARSISTPTQSISAASRVNAGQRFLCPCGRSFCTELSIRETTHVEATSPPATPMLSVKADRKQQQHLPEFASKRQRTLAMDGHVSLIPTTTLTVITDRLTSSLLSNQWQNGNIKHYEDSPELVAGQSNRGDSDIEGSSDDSRCLDEFDAVLSSDKAVVSDFMYSAGLWSTSLSPSNQASLSYSADHHHQDDHSQQRMHTLKPVIGEPFSTFVHGRELSKPLVTIHRRPMLIALTNLDDSSSTHFKCAQCHEVFDSLLLGQEHATTGVCSPDIALNLLDNSDSHLSSTASPLFDSLQENLEEVFNIQLDPKAACSICKKVFSSVHTMMRHKTSIHDRQVRYECNICRRFFFRKDKLTSHMVYHQDFDTYRCCFCSHGCKSRMLMRQHLKREHPNSSDGSHWNETLNQCQVKKPTESQANLPAAFDADRLATSSVKRSLSTAVPMSDMKRAASN